MSNSNKKIGWHVFMESLPNYPQDPFSLIFFSLLGFLFTWMIVFFAIGLLVIMPIGYMGMKDLIYECNTLEIYNQISTTCTTKGWVTFIHNIVSFMITAFLFLGPVKT
jgi:hypothetical protein